MAGVIFSPPPPSGHDPVQSFGASAQPVNVSPGQGYPDDPQRVGLVSQPGDGRIQRREVGWARVGRVGERAARRRQQLRDGRVPGRRGVELGPQGGTTAGEARQQQCVHRLGQRGIGRVIRLGLPGDGVAQPAAGGIDVSGTVEQVRRPGHRRGQRSCFRRRVPRLA